MANIFRKKDQYIDRVNRSTFDLSFVNNLTMKFGAITPVCCLPVGFGDSFQINARFNLQLLPTVFPIQTQLYVRLHFVYVRTRTIWKDWMSFFGGDESVTPPYLNASDRSNPDQFSVVDDLQTGTLADYLGVPTTITGTYGATTDSEIQLSSVSSPVPVDRLLLGFWRGNSSDTIPADSYSLALFLSGKKFRSDVFRDAAVGDPGNSSLLPNYADSTWLAFTFPCDGSSIASDGVLFFEFRFLRDAPVFSNSDILVSFLDSSGTVLDSVASVLTVSVSGTVVRISYPSSELPSGTVAIGFSFKQSTLTPAGSFYDKYVPTSTPSRYYYQWNNVQTVSYLSRDVTWNSPTSQNCPFYSSESEKLPSIPLSALPFRAYEAYYNAFGRDIRNNPFIVDGEPEYNRYVPSVEGGTDSYKYQLHYANWEPDAYTTALQSPQAGIAPLVGITSLGEATFRDAAGTTYSAQLETADDGDTVTGFKMKSSNAPADVVRNLIGMATSGISISDFRNVNSLQRFLEIRVRQSPRYKNLVKGLFDVNLDYDELMMPEFLGGISDTIPVYKVTQTTPTDGNPLGSFAGQGSLQSGMRHVIRKYCPEDGYILGVMSVVPAANYSQLLPPHFTRMSLLDWHFPQFNNISYQPMLYKHLCPYQAYAVNPDNVNNVFGYQRAYWDLISSFDEVHGEFRGSMRNFVINRVFDKAPELSKDFLLVNPDHVNDVFAMTSENGDKILGSIAFDITKKTTIPRNSIPHIE